MCDICAGKEPEQVRREMLARIAEHDYTKVMVQGEREGDVVHPYFTYSVGLWAFHKAPELIVVGPRDRPAAAIVDSYASRVIDGERFTSGQLDYQTPSGLPVLFQKVHPRFYEEWFASAYYCYPRGDFPALQVIWPDKTGQWPWESRWRVGVPQPVLTPSGLPDVDPARLPKAS